MKPIIDFHCDLLVYLEAFNLATAYDAPVRCSIPQLRTGGVKLQVCPVYTETKKGSSLSGRRQAEIFSWLPIKYFEHFDHVTPEWLNSFSDQERIGLALAFENASGFCDELEPLEVGLNRLDFINKQISHVTYISLTWNEENRFGGPQGTAIGLKPDGKTLLQFMDGKNIAVDFSHASDQLVEDVFNAIDANGWNIPVIASHSNCRAVADHPRNLPDPFIREIIKRKGIIGLNFVNYFVGDFAKQVEHFMSLGAQDTLVFGADFFYGDTPPFSDRKPEGGWYFPEFGNASCYQKLLGMLNLSESQKEAIAYRNAERFLKKVNVA